MKNSKKILVTGGTGRLGSAIVAQLLAENYQAKVLSSGIKRNILSNHNTVIADLAKNESLEGVFNGFEVIIHCASNPSNAEKVDVQGTVNMLRHMDYQSLPHLIYTSIVGVEKSDWRYYQYKRQVEKLIQNSGIPWTIFRITQFHEFVLHRVIDPLDNGAGSVFKVPRGMTFQSIDIRDAAEHLVGAVDENATNSIVTLGGPEILRIKEMVKSYLDQTGRTDRIEEWNSNDEFYHIFTTGINLCPEHRAGTKSWDEFIDEHVRRTN